MKKYKRSNDHRKKEREKVKIIKKKMTKNK